MLCGGSGLYIVLHLKVFGVCDRVMCAAAAGCLLVNVTYRSDLQTVFVKCCQVVVVLSDGVLDTCVVSLMKVGASPFTDGCS